MKPDSRAAAHRWAVLKLFLRLGFSRQNKSVEPAVLGLRGGKSPDNKLFLKPCLLLLVDETDKQAPD